MGSWWHETQSKSLTSHGCMKVGVDYNWSFFFWIIKYYSCCCFSLLSPFLLLLLLKPLVRLLLLLLRLLLLLPFWHSPLSLFCPCSCFFLASFFSCLVVFFAFAVFLFTVYNISLLLFSLAALAVFCHCCCSYFICICIIILLFIPIILILSNNITNKEKRAQQGSSQCNHPTLAKTTNPASRAQKISPEKRPNHPLLFRHWHRWPINPWAASVMMIETEAILWKLGRAPLLEEIWNG